MDTDNNTVISDITDNNTIISDEQKQYDILNKTETNLNNLTNDTLRDKCKELEIKNISKMKKPEMIQALMIEFGKNVSLLKDYKANDLKFFCKQYNIKFNTNVKKDELFWLALNYCSDNLVFNTKLQEPEPKKDSKAKKEPELKEPEQKEEPKSLLEQLEKQRLEIETKMKEELRKQEEERKKLEDLKKEEERKLQEEEDKKKKEEAKKKKQAIPKNVRTIVWNHYIGDDIIRHRCLCCKKVLISNTNFEVGHVLSEKNGGTHEINNLRPICFACNHSMGSENMIDFVVKYGLYIG